MAKVHYCATCGKRLKPLHAHFMYDEKTGKVVRVCSDDRSCQRRYLKRAQ